MNMISSRMIRIALLISVAALPLGAQRGARRGQATGPDTTPAKKIDTSVVRKTPDGFVLDFQEQELRVVLEAIAEAGGLNVTFANLPAIRVTLRMGQQVSKAEALDILRGVAEINGLKMTEGPSLIRIEGTRAVTPAQQQATAQQQQQLKLFTYRLKHASAVTLAPVLMSLLTGTTGGGVQGNGAANVFGNGVVGVPGAGGVGGGAGGGRGGAAAPGRAGAGGGAGGGAAGNPNIIFNPGAGGAAQAGIAQALQQAFGGGGALTTAASQMRIVAEEATNSLIVRATDSDWALVQQVLGSVDLRPLQVLIEVTIVQVQRTHDLNLGIGGNATRKSASGVGTDTTFKFPSQAGVNDIVSLLTAGSGSVKYAVALNALQSRGDVKVLSLPVIIAQNNKQAILNVGQNVPFVQVSQSAAIVGTGLVQTIQYQSVGTTLTITPIINPDGYVNLTVSQTDDNATNDVQFNAPIISQRQASTQVFIRDGQTTVIGGLTDNTTSTTVSGIPILSKIPWIGGLLFGNTQKTVTANELYLFLTPHVVSSDEDIDKLREATKNQSELLEHTDVKARIVPRGDTIQVGDPVKKPAAPAAAPANFVKPDTAKKKPDGARK